jgi:mediator of RNA polymerase II transcription subunit 5
MEFGSVLLLVLTFVHRYGLTAADLGIRSSQSFMSKLLNGGHLHKQLEELSDQEKSQLGGWIQGLFDTESGALGDELMSSCRPQDFSLLISTLFYQTVLALSTDRLTEDSLKNGVECRPSPIMMVVKQLTCYRSRGHIPPAITGNGPHVPVQSSADQQECRAKGNH